MYERFDGKDKRYQQKDLDLGETIILKWLLRKQGGVVWTGVIWQRIGASRGLW
jgi:hypothetical protein